MWKNMRSNKKSHKSQKTNTSSTTESESFCLTNPQEILKLQSLILKLSLDDFIIQFSQYFARIITPKTQEINTQSYDSHLNSIISFQFLTHILNITDSKKMQYLIHYFNTTQHSAINLPILPHIRELDQQLAWLKKGANLSMQEIIACTQIVKFFYDLQKLDSATSPHKKDFGAIVSLTNQSSQDFETESQKFFSEYIQSFTFSDEICCLLTYFIFENSHQDNPAQYIKRGVDKELDSYRDNLESKLKDKEIRLCQILTIPSLQEFLIDTQIHRIQDNMALLVRAGFANILPARTIARSNRGFFYIVPLSLESLQQEIYLLQDKIEQRVAFLAKEYSSIYRKHLHFLRYVNKEFDCMDKVIARVRFAREYDLEFVFPYNISQAHGTNTSKENTPYSIVLHEYIHPSLKKPKPLSINFSKNLLLITGVNAGGKTMLLKSILSALFCTKYLLPFRINPHKSHIPSIKNIAIIAQDPQDSNQDISTFSGRIKEFNEILPLQELIVGIDEIERGTDASEAASLYKVLLDSLLENHAKIIVTTHHKHLASLMAGNPQTQLMAALYDVKSARPQYEFIDGIGKSYAMECAAFYGIPKNLIAKARELHGSEANRLERLIEESNYQITKNKQHALRLESLIEQKNLELQKLEQDKVALKKQFETQSLKLKRHYHEAIKEIKMLAREANAQTSTSQKQDTLRDIHKLLNKAHKQRKQEPNIRIQSNKVYNIGTWVKYHGNLAKIIAKDEILQTNHSSMNPKNKDSQKTQLYTIELNNGVRLKSISSIELENAESTLKKQKIIQTSYTLQADIQASTRLDLHGHTAQEAIASLEEFFNQALMAKFHEVLIVHGIGSGTLQRIVIEYLENADFVRGFVNAPANMGGMGAKIVYLH
ncbi:Smr/MutS family protein [Helicobacter sp. MIT 14-3879]|uniref:Smr/MutS family protein n=1 Tax=Helicobacter sp. MIT 14-3879 TaxID=2040649 RepID=UPI000E1EE19A|nr:Smr/MutS family protein [Helicobacter sp. MIT 14-3879]RDU61527.1 recombination and DNA strand exchange inhibitor protein [Helicobacter sp. MIT 14-3879]